MKIWLTSDTHFYHNNILKYEPESRPFKDINHMNETIVKNWNEKVSLEDIVYVCGDFFMGAAENVSKILPRLNGKKIIVIRGNHDTEAKINEYLKDSRVSIAEYDVLLFENVFIVLNHYPRDMDLEKESLFVRRNSFSTKGWEAAVDAFNKIKGDKIYCYGHVHSKGVSDLKKANYHVGMDTNNLYPVLLDDIVRKYKEEKEEE